MSGQTNFFYIPIDEWAGELSTFCRSCTNIPYTVCVDVMGLNEQDKFIAFCCVSIGYNVTSSKHANFRPCVGLCYVILTLVFCLINSWRLRNNKSRRLSTSPANMHHTSKMEVFC